MNQPSYDILVDPALIEAISSIRDSIDPPTFQKQQEKEKQQQQTNQELPLSLHHEPHLSSSYPSQQPSQASTSSLLQLTPRSPSPPSISPRKKKKFPTTISGIKKLTQAQQKVLAIENARTNQILGEAVRFATASAIGADESSSSNNGTFGNLNSTELLLLNDMVGEEGSTEGGTLEQVVINQLDMQSFMSRLVSNELESGNGKSMNENSEDRVNKLLREEQEFHARMAKEEAELAAELASGQGLEEVAEEEEEEEEEIDYGLKANGKPKKKRGRPKGKKDDPELKLDGKNRGRPKGIKNVKGYKKDILAKAYAEGTLTPPTPKKRGRPKGGKNHKKDQVQTNAEFDEFGNIIQYSEYDIYGSHPRELEYREAIDRYGAIEVLQRYQTEQYRAVAEAAAALTEHQDEMEE